MSFALEPREIRQTVIKERIKAADDRALRRRQTGRAAKAVELAARLLEKTWSPTCWVPRRVRQAIILVP